MNAVPQTGDDFTEVGAEPSGRSGAQSWRVAVGAGALRVCSHSARWYRTGGGHDLFSCVTGETIAFLHSKAIGAACINPRGASMVVLVAHPTIIHYHTQRVITRAHGCGDRARSLSTWRAALESVACAV